MTAPVNCCRPPSESAGTRREDEAGIGRLLRFDARRADERFRAQHLVGPQPDEPEAEEKQDDES